MNFLYFIYLFIGILILRFLLNLNKFLLLRKAILKQDLFVRGNFEGATEKDIEVGNVAGNWVEAHISDIKRSVKGAGVNDNIRTYMEPVGLGYAQQKSMSTLDNMLFRNIEFLTGARDLMKRAKGYYQVEMIKCFNPLYWIEFIVFLPKHIINYFNFESKSKSNIINIIQIIYWVLTIIISYLNYLNTVH